MNYFEEPGLGMQREYGQGMPFYLTYPMTNLYQTEKEYERDMERMKELYPKRMKKLLAYVEEECDKMEYEGSIIPIKCFCIGRQQKFMTRRLRYREQSAGIKAGTETLWT